MIYMLAFGYVFRVRQKHLLFSSYVLSKNPKLKQNRFGNISRSHKSYKWCPRAAQTIELMFYVNRFFDINLYIDDKTRFLLLFILARLHSQ